MLSFIIILVLIIILVIVIKKVSGKKKLNAPVPLASQSEYSLFDISKEDISERNREFDAMMLGPKGEELTQCYNRIRKIFIPTKKDGTYEGALSGMLGTGSRAKTLEQVDRTVFSAIGDNRSEYEMWYAVVYDRILNEQISSPNGKLSGAAIEVYRDAVAGDVFLQDSNFHEMLQEGIERDVKSKKAIVKFKKGKDGKLTYTVKKLYKWFPEGLNMEDPLIHAAEILIGISSFSECQRGCTTFRSDIEKYKIPASIQKKE